MTKPLLAALALAASFTGPAHAAVPPPVTGLTCGLASTSDILLALSGPFHQSGVLWGGPVASTGTVSIQCSIQTNGTGVYSDPDAVSTPVATGSLVAVSTPQPVIFQWRPGIVSAYVCTTVTGPDGSIWYYDDASGRLSNNATTAKCTLASSQQVPPDEVCDLASLACAATTALCVTANCDLPAAVYVSLPKVFETIV